MSEVVLLHQKQRMLFVCDSLISITESFVHLKDREVDRYPDLARSHRSGVL